MRPWTALFLLAVACLAGCDNFATEVCPRPLTNDQGETYRCAAAEDCPRPAHILLCTSDTGVEPLPECIRCQDTRCVRVAQEAC